MRNSKLGLVCITTSEAVRYRTVTKTRLESLRGRQRSQHLRELYMDNIARLSRALDFCAENKIFLYRIVSSILPFSDTPLGERIVDELSESMAQIGAKAESFGIRMVCHPDQFVVLNSDSESVIANSIKILRGQARFMDAFGLPRSTWACLEIHGGKGGRAERLIHQVEKLEESIRSRLVFENDERIYSAAQILEICRATGCPMVFDAHHHVVYEKLDSYDHPSVGEYLEAAAQTWPRRDWQLVHISNGRESFADPRHSDLIHTMPKSYSKAPWIEIEAKLKEEAIAKLRSDLNLDQLPRILRSSPARKEALGLRDKLPRAFGSPSTKRLRE